MKKSLATTSALGAGKEKSGGATRSRNGVALTGRSLKPEIGTGPDQVFEAAPVGATFILLLLRDFLHGLLDGGLRLRRCLRRCRLLRFLLCYHWHCSNSFVTEEVTPCVLVHQHIGYFASIAQHFVLSTVMHERHAITNTR